MQSVPLDSIRRAGITLPSVTRTMLESFIFVYCISLLQTVVLPKRALHKRLSVLNLKRLRLAVLVYGVSGIVYFALNLLRLDVYDPYTWVMFACNGISTSMLLALPYLSRLQNEESKPYFVESVLRSVWVFTIISALVLLVSQYVEYSLSQIFIVPFIYIITINFLFYYKKFRRLLMNILLTLILVFIVVQFDGETVVEVSFIFSSVLAGFVAQLIGDMQSRLWMESAVKGIDIEFQLQEKQETVTALVQVLDKVNQSIGTGAANGVVRPQDVEENPSILIDKIDGLVNQVITEKRKAEQSYSDYNDLFNSTYDAYTVLNEEGRVVDANPAFKHLTGYDVQAGEEVYVKDIVHPDDREKSKQFFKKLIEEGGYKGYEGRLLTKDGGVCYVEVSSKGIFNKQGDIVGSKDLIRNITEKKKLELRDKEQLRLDKMLEEVSELFLLDSDATIHDEIDQTLAKLGVFFDVGRCYIFSIDDDFTLMHNTFEWCAPGVEPEIDNLQNLPLTVFGWWTEKMLKKEIINIPNLEEPPYNSLPIYELLKEQGIQSLLAVPMIFQGKTVGFLGFDDVRGPRHWSPQSVYVLRKSAEIFNSLIQSDRINKEKEAVIAELALKNEELADFAHIVSHDLKAPLRGMVTVVDWLQEDLAEKLDDDTKEHMRLLVDRAGRMENLINDILEYSSLDAQNKREDIALTYLFDDICKGLVFEGRLFEVVYDNHLPVIQGFSYVRLFQLFQNLITNAIKYNDKEKAIVNLLYSKEKEGHRFTVSDNGMGIEMKYRDKIFEIFQKLDNNKPNSTGIGLAIVKKVVNLYNGSVSMQSTLKEGTEFTIILPFQKNG